VIRQACDKFIGIEERSAQQSTANLHIYFHSSKVATFILPKARKYFVFYGKRIKFAVRFGKYKKISRYEKDISTIQTQAREQARIP